MAFFFVLSGFVLSYNYRQLGSWTEVKLFWLSRFARIYPVHLLGLLLAGIPIAIILASKNFSLLESAYALKAWYGKVAGLDVTASWFLVVSLGVQLLLLSAWLPFAPISNPWNGPAWSISCEAFFYALFPAILPKIQRLSTSKILIMLFLAWLVQGAWLGMLSISSARPGLISQFPPSHLFEFLLGMCTAEIFTRHRLDFLRKFSLPVLFACVLFAVVLGIYSPISPDYYILSPIFAVSILTMASMDDKISSIPGLSIFVLLGEASYAMYILHMPIITTYEATGRPIPLAVLVGLVLVTSIAVHLLFEEPARKAIRRKFGLLISGKPRPN